MGKVIIEDLTPIDPINIIGEMAGICYGTDTKDIVKNYNRGIDCIKSRHGRTLEFPDIYMTLDGYSARVIREFYTHIGGAPTRLQASTRYIDYTDFDFITPPKILQNITAQNIYHQAMQDIAKALTQLDMLNIPKEDSANLLPLGMTTKVVVKVNLRELIQIFNQRMCTRAYWEFREMMNDIKNALIEYGKLQIDLFSLGNQWETIADSLFVPKCIKDGFCYEKHSCGLAPKAEQKEFN